MWSDSCSSGSLLLGEKQALSLLDLMLTRGDGVFTDLCLSHVYAHTVSHTHTHTDTHTHTHTHTPNTHTDTHTHTHTHTHNESRHSSSSLSLLAWKEAYGRRSYSIILRK